MEKAKRKWFKTDPYFLSFLLVLVLIGILMGYSTSYYKAIMNNESFVAPLVSVSFWAVAGIVVFIITSYFPYKLYFAAAPLLLIISLLLLLILLFTPMGIVLNGAKRWLDFKYFTLMPSELVKVFGIFFIAFYFTLRNTAKSNFFRDAFPIYIITGIFFFLIYIQPNLSTALIVSLIFVGMIFLAEVRLTYIIIPGVLAGFLVFMMILSKGGYHLQRINSLQNFFEDERGTGYQISQSLKAIASGGLWGKGIGKGLSASMYLPEAENDFIFSALCEEFGIIGAAITLIVYFGLIYRAAKITMNTDNKFAYLVSCGIVIMISLQVIFNVLVATAVIPPTGIILPFISQGGTATLIMMFSMGVLYNIARSSK
jgi:cell division protein FtsW